MYTFIWHSRIYIAVVWFKTQKVCSDRQELVTMKNKFVNEFRNKVRVDAKKVVYCIDDDALIKHGTDHVLKDRAVKLNGYHQWLSMT